MDKLFHTVMEIIYWIMIFLCPVLLCAIAGVAVIASMDTGLLPLYISLAIGGTVGIIMAERIRRKYGCVAYWSRILATPDISPTRTENQENKNDHSQNKDGL